MANLPEADHALISPLPPPLSSSVLRRDKDSRSPLEIELETYRTDGRALTNCTVVILYGFPMNEILNNNCYDDVDADYDNDDNTDNNDNDDDDDKGDYDDNDDLMMIMTIRTRV